MSDETIEQLAREVSEERTPIKLPQTPLGEVAELLLKAQELNMEQAPRYHRSEKQLSINDLLAQARIRVDMLRGGPD